MDEPRSAPLIQVFFAGQLSDEELLMKFEGFAEMMRAILSVYDRIGGIKELVAQLGYFIGKRCQIGCS